VERFGGHAVSIVIAPHEPRCAARRTRS
jgi:hypothetical protein